MAESSRQPDASLQGSAGDEDEGDQKFVFIHASDPQMVEAPAARRRLIHQHAMREIGRSRRKPKKNPTVELQVPPLLEDSGRTAPTSSWLGSMWSGSNPLDPFLRFPMELDATARELTAYMFDDDRGQQRPLRDAWFTVALQDEATFNQVLSNSALHMEIMRRGRDGVRETPDSIRYHTKTITSIRRRVEGAKPETLEAIIGAVTGMMAYAGILGSDDGFISHHKGLQELIRLRGGLESIEANEALRLTMTWCELRGVYLLDMKPAIPSPRQWAKFSKPFLSNFNPRIADCTGRLQLMWTNGGLAGTEWLNIYKDLISFSLQSFDEDTTTPRLSTMPPDYGAWSSPMIHRLLSWRPADDRRESRESVIEETCRLGALLYLIPVWRFFGVLPAPSRVLRQHLQAILTAYDADWSHVWVVKLWSLYMGGVEALGSVDEDWYAENIVKTLVDHEISNWDQGMRRIKDVLWFRCLFVDTDDRLAARVSAMLSNS